MIELQNVSFKNVIHELNLKIEPGEFITVVGSNGAGKSTLLNLIAGVCRPTSGSILFNGEDVTQLPVQKRAGMVSRVFQDPMIGTCSELTVAENLALARSRGGSRRLRAAIRSSDATNFTSILRGLDLRIDSLLNKQVRHLSGGERQALALIIATLSPSTILLLDEHTSALDPRMAEKIMELTNRLVAEKSLTTFMVTHSLKQSLEVGTRTLMLHDGKIIFEVAGMARTKLTMKDLLDKFVQATHASNSVSSNCFASSTSFSLTINRTPPVIADK